MYRDTAGDSIRKRTHFTACDDIAQEADVNILFALPTEQLAHVRARVISFEHGLHEGRARVRIPAICFEASHLSPYRIILCFLVKGGSLPDRDQRSGTSLCERTNKLQEWISYLIIDLNELQSQHVQLWYSCVSRFAPVAALPGDSDQWILPTHKQYHRY